MKKIIILMATLAVCAGAQARGGSSGHSSSKSSTASTGTGHVNPSSHAIRGHTTKDGVYVPPSRATNPNDTKTDNYTQKGNVNPNTGKEGTKD